MKKELFILLVALFLAGCSANKKNDPPPVVKPGRASLSTPSQNEVCTTGTIISDTESSVVFSWDASENTNSYELVLKNLLTSSAATQNTAKTQLTITLSRNTPYSWYIVSKSTQTSDTVRSATWKFYNSGPGVVTYAPFPAEIVSPTFGQDVTATAGKVNLQWTGSSVTPGTIANYDVYFGKSTSPDKLKNTITDSFVNGVNVTSKTTYYWHVITRDIQGNTSDSGLYQFMVK